MDSCIANLIQPINRLLSEEVQISVIEPISEERLVKRGLTRLINRCVGDSLCIPQVRQEFLAQNFFQAEAHQFYAQTPVSLCLWAHLLNVLGFREFLITGTPEQSAFFGFLRALFYQAYRLSLVPHVDEEAGPPIHTLLTPELLAFRLFTEDLEGFLTFWALLSGTPGEPETKHWLVLTLLEDWPNQPPSFWDTWFSHHGVAFMGFLTQEVGLILEGPIDFQAFHEDFLEWVNLLMLTRHQSLNWEALDVLILKVGLVQIASFFPKIQSQEGQKIEGDPWTAYIQILVRQILRISAAAFICPDNQLRVLENREFMSILMYSKTYFHGPLIRECAFLALRMLTETCEEARQALKAEQD